MPSTKGKKIEAIHRGSAWCSAHSDLINSSASVAPGLVNQVASLASVSTTLNQLAISQETHKGQATLAAHDEPSLARTLRTQHIAPIVKVAVALKASVPGISLVKAPSSSIRAASLVSASEAFASTAAIYKDVFVEHGLPSDVIDQLNASIGALRASVDARGMAKSALVAASASVKSYIETGHRLTSTIDASLSHILSSDPATLKAWRQAKRVPASASASQPVAAPAPVPVPAAPVTPSPVAPTA